jgi:hypothetical protein
MIAMIVTRKRGDGKTPTLCERDTRQLLGTNLIHPLARDVKDTLLTRERQLTVESLFYNQVFHMMRTSSQPYD